VQYCVTAPGLAVEGRLRMNCTQSVCWYIFCSFPGDNASQSSHARPLLMVSRCSMVIPCFKAGVLG